PRAGLAADADPLPRAGRREGEQIVEGGQLGLPAHERAQATPHPPPTALARRAEADDAERRRALRPGPARPRLDRLERHPRLHLATDLARRDDVSGAGRAEEAD